VTAIHRAPMRARDRDDVAPGAGAEFGLRRGVVGIGDGDGARVRRLADLPDDAFVWTRDTAGRYWLGRVAGAYRYDHSAAARAVGIVHTRPARWLASAVGDDDVPAAVAATFARGGRNLQRTHDAEAERATAALWAAARQDATATPTGCS
jgi:hypothetical protein